jgi:glutamate racemase
MYYFIPTFLVPFDAYLLNIQFFRYVTISVSATDEFVYLANVFIEVCASPKFYVLLVLQHVQLFDWEAIVLADTHYVHSSTGFFQHFIKMQVPLGREIL